MKQLIILLCAMGIIFSCAGQSTSISIASNKTTSLIFPFMIKHVDRGTKDILVQQVAEAKNILFVKAAVKNFGATNLSVVTEDGSLYGFTINYQSDPVRLIYHLPVKDKESASFYARDILDNQGNMHGIKDHSWGVISKVKGIYVKDDIIYYQLQIINKSQIDYDLDFLHFYLSDKKKVKRTAFQENQISPVITAGNTKCIKANSNSIIVVGIKKFTIPNGRQLVIDIHEKDGGRNLIMKVENKKIIHAAMLPDLK
jgi:conjugative transposon TraN protein